MSQDNFTSNKKFPVYRQNEGTPQSPTTTHQSAMLIKDTEISRLEHNIHPNLKSLDKSNLSTSQEIIN